MTLFLHVTHFWLTPLPSSSTCTGPCDHTGLSQTIQDNILIQRPINLIPSTKSLLPYNVIYTGLTPGIRGQTSLGEGHYSTYHNDPRWEHQKNHSAHPNPKTDPQNDEKIKWVVCKRSNNELRHAARSSIWSPRAKGNSLQNVHSKFLCSWITKGSLKPWKLLETKFMGLRVQI